MSAEHDDLTVTYGVKELLARFEKALTEGFARVEKGLETKADKRDISRIEGRLDAHQTRIEALEKRQDKDDSARNAAQEVRQSHTEWKRWAIPTALTVVWIIVALFTSGAFK